jgi:predicted transcriptional regulator YdeE
MFSNKIGHWDLFTVVGIAIQIENSDGNNHEISNHHQAKLLEEMFAQNEQF